MTLYFCFFFFFFPANPLKQTVINHFENHNKCRCSHSCRGSICQILHKFIRLSWKPWRAHLHQVAHFLYKSRSSSTVRHLSHTYQSAKSIFVISENTGISLSMKLQITFLNLVFFQFAATFNSTLPASQHHPHPSECIVVSVYILCFF